MKKLLNSFFLIVLTLDAFSQNMQDRQKSFGDHFTPLWYAIGIGVVWFIGLLLIHFVGKQALKNKPGKEYTKMEPVRTAQFWWGTVCVIGGIIIVFRSCT